MLKSALSHFKTFPEFSKLTSQDKEVYEAYLQQFPPCTSLSFGTLMTWWHPLGSPSVAVHDRNLIISLWYPGLDESSGFTVIGRHKLDETICAIFDYQKQRGEKPCLTNVPEFVVNRIRYPEMFVFDSQRQSDECIVDVDTALDFDKLPVHKKQRLRKLLAAIGEDSIQVLPIDLDSVYERDNLLRLIDEWRDESELNGAFKHEEEAAVSAIRGGAKYGYWALGLYIDRELHGFLVLADSLQDDYVIISHSRLSYAFPHFIDLAIYAFGKWFQENGVRWVNVDADFDIPLLRSTRLYMGPSNFLRMYRVTPKA